MRNNNFDFLRFYLAFNVVISHFIGVSRIADIQKFQHFFNAFTSVTGFFIISGFLITNSYIHSKSIKDYFLKRASRLLPAYIFVILASALLLSFTSSYSLYEYFTSSGLYKYLATNLVFLNFLQPCLPGVFTINNDFCAVNGALWTLKIEVLFYLCVPLIVFLTNRFKKKYILFISIYVLSIIYKLSFSYLNGISNSGFYGELANQLPGFMSYFVSGIACYYYNDFFKKYNLKLFVLGVLIFVFESYFDVEFLKPIALSIIIFTVAFNFKKLNTFAKYGDISYGIYIFHLPLIQVAVHFGLFKSVSTITSFSLIISSVLISGLLSWHLLEKKFLNKNRKVIKID
jgi:peptidoglycan/LPS O-acetylase OafA/YrhL